jgi:hypothetical protein
MILVVHMILVVRLMTGYNFVSILKVLDILTHIQMTTF